MPKHHQSPVFFDPTTHRWRRVMRMVTVAAVIVIILLGSVMVAVSINPGLPPLALDNTKVYGKRAEMTPATIAAREVKFEAARKALDQHLRKSLPPVPAVPRGQFERVAFYVNWDDNSWVSLKRNVGNIDTLIAEWIHLSDAQGNVIVDDAHKQDIALTYIRKHRPDLPIIALINNFHDGIWDVPMIRGMLKDPQARQHCIDGIEQFIKRWQLAGVSIDFEAIPNDAQAELVTFMQELYSRLHPQHLHVSQSVPLDDERYQFAQLAKYNDYLILMAYDENASDNPAGPIASQSWFVNHIQRRMQNVPAEKLVVGIGSYGYDWVHGKTHAEELSFQDALRLAESSDDEIELDENSGNPKFTYVDESNIKHDVWFLDAVTAFNQVTAATRLSPHGFALWRLGSEDPDVWQVLTKPSALNADVAKRLETLSFGYDLDYEGKGEILRVVGTPEDGERNVSYDIEMGLLTDDDIKKFPRGYVIQRWGFDKNKSIALTFDDGPDPVFTPQILDILRVKQVHATFFIIGTNGESYPELIDRIDAEGHDIGNHTYTHPNIADVSEKRTTLELNATERLFESRIGRRSLLFRPPYAEDVEPETPDQVRPLVFTTSLGYYSVGMQIDPDDWRKPPADEITKRVMEGAANGDGNVVLLHDAGGDRSATVEALPKLIDELRAQGYRLVTISELLHAQKPEVTRDSVMPEVKENKIDVGLWLEAYGFVLINDVGRLLRALFILGISFGIARFAIILILALYRRRHRVAESTELPRVSIVVPAYNEEKLITRTINTLLSSEGVQFEIIVVDDGSTDGTAQAVLETFSSNSRVRFIRQENAGKAEALNTGIREAREDIIVALDADTLFMKDTVAQLAKHFSDEKIGAVAGNAKVGNRLNLLTRWQALEYVTSQNLDRRAFEKLNCITVVPGAVGAWRRKAIIDAGGFRSDTLAEDADLTMRIVRNGYRVVYEPDAHAYTEAPQTFRAFLNQRYRWMYGTLQACWKHREILFRRKGGTLGFIALPNVIIFQIAFPLISPVMDFTMLWTTIEALINYSQHPSAGMSSAFWHSLYYYGLFLSLDMITALIAYLFEPDEEWRLLPWLLLQRFCYRQLMYYVAIRSFVSALRGPYVGWGKIQRYGSVKEMKEEQV
ncbi:MAG TPA: glycosyltransferase [Steroidobacteraceae bacterium]|nr:glycosyltransferase [Steroidobacteraceae bacterium]